MSLSWSLAQECSVPTIALRVAAMLCEMHLDCNGADATHAGLDLS